MEIRFVNSVVLKRRAPIAPYFPESIFLLMRIAENKEYVDGAYTDKVVAHTLECVDTIDFRHIKVKIDGEKNPLGMTDAELQALRQSGEKVAVEFVNATVMPYVNERRQSIEDSFKADGVMLVTEN